RATASPPWRTGPYGSIEPGDLTPQWGHGVTAVENRPVREHRARGPHAAMGPRRHRRGDLNTSATFTPGNKPQWGHGVTAVETRARRRRPGRGSGCRNGATA